MCRTDIRANLITYEQKHAYLIKIRHATNILAFILCVSFAGRLAGAKLLCEATSKARSERFAAISLAILGHSTNTVAANYGSGYALEVMREALMKVWEE